MYKFSLFFLLVISDLTLVNVVASQTDLYEITMDKQFCTSSFDVSEEGVTIMGQNVYFLPKGGLQPEFWGKKDTTLNGLYISSFVYSGGVYYGKSEGDFFDIVRMDKDNQEVFATIPLSPVYTQIWGDLFLDRYLVLEHTVRGLVSIAVLDLQTNSFNFYNLTHLSDFQFQISSMYPRKFGAINGTSIYYNSPDNMTIVNLKTETTRFISFKNITESSIMKNLYVFDSNIYLFSNNNSVPVSWVYDTSTNMVVDQVTLPFTFENPSQSFKYIVKNNEAPTFVYSLGGEVAFATVNLTSLNPVQMGVVPTGEHINVRGTVHGTFALMGMNDRGCTLFTPYNYSFPQWLPDPVEEPDYTMYYLLGGGLGAGLLVIIYILKRRKKAKQ